MTKDFALTAALGAIELHLLHHVPGCVYLESVVPVIKEALAQPEQEPLATKTEKGITLHVGWDDLPADTKLYTSPPKREWESTTDMMMALADRLGELPDDVDPRAWTHLLVYAPKPDLTDADRKTYQAGHNAGVAHHKQATKREWVGLTFAEVNEIEQDGEFWEDHTPIDFANAIEAKLKELNAYD